MESRPALRNPLLGLPDTANTIFNALKKIEDKILIEMLKHVHEQYMQYTKSFIWRWSASTPRDNELKEIISLLEQNNQQDLVKIVNDLLNDSSKESGQYSVNHYLMLSLLNFAGYDHTQISSEQINLLQIALLTIFSRRELEMSLITPETIPEESRKLLTEEELEEKIQQGNSIQKMAAKFAATNVLVQAVQEKKSQEAKIEAATIKADKEKTARMQEAKALCKKSENIAELTSLLVKRQKKMDEETKVGVVAETVETVKQPSSLLSNAEFVLRRNALNEFLSLQVKNGNKQQEEIKAEETNTEETNTEETNTEETNTEETSPLLSEMEFGLRREALSMSLFGIKPLPSKKEPKQETKIVIKKNPRVSDEFISRCDSLSQMLFGIKPPQAIHEQAISIEQPVRPKFK
jgi:hypothetical protein